MAIKIFYSWQSDLPNNTNRGFIKNALDNVAKIINGNIESADRENEIEIDTATKNVIGTINIADKILKKIDECDIFVADISIIGKIDSFNKGEKNRVEKLLIQTSFLSLVMLGKNSVKIRLLR